MLRLGLAIVASLVAGCAASGMSTDERHYDDALTATMKDFAASMAHVRAATNATDRGTMTRGEWADVLNAERATVNHEDATTRALSPPPRWVDVQAHALNATTAYARYLLDVVACITQSDGAACGRAQDEIKATADEMTTAASEKRRLEG